MDFRPRRDADGFLSIEEYTNGLAEKSRAPQRFAAFDKNKDGQVSPEEFIKP
ncbi:MAG: hypothetical protein KDM63_09055 [Verrucomicrobiae bacterium]|nr:hypothetical protein [Verrucomicrobiae bacterium]